MHHITLRTNMKKMNQQFAVYTVFDALTAKAVYVGTCKLNALFMLSEARGVKEIEHDRDILIQVTDICDSKGEAIKQQYTRLNQFNIILAPKNRSQPVQCVTSGAIYESAKAAAVDVGASASNMSNHLNNKPGFATVKGNVFQKII